MSNALVPAQSGGFLATNDDDFLARLSGVVENLDGGGGDHAFLKMDGNNGQYSYGSDAIELPLGTQLVMDYRSFRQGWIIWVQGKVADQVMVNPVEQAVPTRNSLPDHGPYGKEEGPREQQTIMFSMVEEPFAQLLFNANNKSKMNALGAVMKDFIKSFKLHPGSYPVIEIDSKSFEGTDKETGRKYKKYAPSFRIVSWMSADELNAMSEGNPSDYEQDGEGPVEEVQAALPAPEPEPTPAPAPQQQARPAPAPSRAATPRTPAQRPAPAPAPQTAAAAPAAPSTAAPARRSRF